MSALHLVSRFNTPVWPRRRRRHAGPKQIALRIPGVVREPWGGRLPPKVKAALRLIAEDEGKSVSWVMEEIVIRFFNLPRPRYIPRKRRTR